MDLIHMVLNLITPSFTFFSLLFLLPPYQFFKLFLYPFCSPENVDGKVVLITGASSGIGKYLAYEYARRGACLALCARRANCLREVADMARELGSPDVITVPADVSKVDDCRRFVDYAVNHFGRLDHLVNNAGLAQASMLVNDSDITNLRPVMDVNFWGMVYASRFAAPHLARAGGKIVFLSSVGSWLHAPRMSIYNASKAAIVAFADTLRVEFGSDIHITVVTPGFVESEMTQGKFLDSDGKLKINQEMRDVQVGLFPVGRVGECAQTIVDGVCRGKRYVTEPAWYNATYYWTLFFPELVESIARMMYIASPGGSAIATPSKKILDFFGAQKLLYPEPILSDQVKAD